MLVPFAHSFRLLSKKNTETHHKDTIKDEKVSHPKDVNESSNRKRSFLKLAGVVGVGALATSLIPRKAEALVFGSSPTSSTVGLKDSNNNRIDPAKESGGNLASIAANTSPLMSSSAGGYIRQDSNATIAKESGGNLSTIATNTANIPAKGQATMANSTPVVIASNQTAIPVSATFSGSLGSVGMLDTTSTQVNPSTDDSLQYLRRIVKLMESQAVVDSGNRQRITLDSIGTGTAVTTTVPISGSVTASGTVTANLAAGSNAVGSITAIDGYNHQMFQDFAKTAFATGIRNNLIFS